MTDPIDPAAPTVPVVPAPAPSALRHGRMVLLLVACAIFIIAYLAITPLEVAIARHYLPIDFDDGQVTQVNSSWAPKEGDITVNVAPRVVRSIISEKYGWWVPPFLLHEGPSASGYLQLDTDQDQPLKIPWTVQLYTAMDPPTVTGGISAEKLASVIAPYCDLDYGLMSLKLSVDHAQLWVGTGMSGRYQAGMTASGTMQIGYGASGSTVVIKRLAAHTLITFEKVAGGWTPQLAIQLDSIDIADPNYAVLNLAASRAQLSQLIMAKLTPQLTAIVIPEWFPRNVEVQLSVGTQK